MARTSIRETETEPKINGTATAFEPNDDSTDERSIEALHEAYERQPGAYRDKAQVFRTQDDKPQRQGGWILDLDCTTLNDARLVIASSQFGGRGLYQVVLMDRVTGKRARIAYVRIESDLREAVEKKAEAQSSNTALDILREQLSRVESRSRELESQLMTSSPRRGDADLTAALATIDRLTHRLDEARDRAQSRYEEGYDIGFKRGKLLGESEGKLEGKIEALNKVKKSSDDNEGGWKPADVRDVVKEVGAVLRGDGSGGHNENMDLVSLAKQAIALGMSAKQTLEMVRTLKGPQLLQSIAVYVANLGAQALADPEIIALIEARPDAQEWFETLLSELRLVVPSGDGPR